ncbi:UDP-N-acetylmuramoyl-L-alanine--D-glutamate ligase [Comamonadaceae bacterium M7527]|nr:UDP-N-acetylmuramoyl-L-alanine--D-glutamate ligase [Comamonadaceae bacterium M7527]
MTEQTAPSAVLVLGAGVSGLAMARWCVRMGAQVTVADTRQDTARLQQLQTAWPQLSFVQCAFDSTLMASSNWGAVYRSPGLSPAQLHEVRSWCDANGVIYGNEVDLFVQGLIDHEPPPDLPAVESAPADDDQAMLAQAQALNETVDEAVTEAVADVSAMDDDQEGPDDDIKNDEVEGDAEGDVEGDGVEAHECPIEPAAPISRKPKVLAVTGTNGKTTVCALTAQLLQRAGVDAIAAGNIAPSLLDALSACLDEGRWPQVWVLELSSFQLDHCTSLQPDSATIVNISQDHLDWHGDMASYVAAKGHVFGNLGLRLLNRDDPQVMQFQPEPPAVPKRGEAVAPHAKWASFGTDTPTRVGDWGLDTTNGLTWLVRAQPLDDTIQKPKRGQVAAPVEVYMQRLMPADALRIRGQHNATNALLALALATSTGADLAAMLHGLREYTGEAHRMQSVAVVNDVEYFDDSKGTNVGATLAAIKGLGNERRLVVILGGDGKGQDFTPLNAAVAQYARAVVLIGRDAPAIRQALASTGVPLLDATDMAHAVTISQAQAQTGDAVLLSPACASFDMFDNYAHRARVFTQAVSDLAADAGVELS